MSDYEVFVSTPIEIAHEKLRLADLRPGECLLDPGCGDGAVLIHGAREFGARCIGLEVRPELAEAAREAGHRAGVGAAMDIRCEDFMESDVSGVDVVVIYLTRNSMGPLSIKLENELSAGARIVTHTFDLPGWEHTAHVQRCDASGQVHELYLYRVPGG